MDNFNLQGYIASGKLYANSKTLTEAKKQGYDDREDESLGARRGAEKGKKQSMKARRDDSYGKFGKRDAEKKGKNKINKESQGIEEGFLDFLKKKKEAAPVKKEDPNPIIGVDYDGNYIRKDGTMAEDMNEGLLDFLKKKKEAAPVKREDPNPIIGVDYDGNYIRKDGTMAESAVTEDARTDAEQEGYKDGFKDAKADMKDALTKMKVSELKAKIRENILSTLNEADEEDMDHQDALDKASATGSTKFMKEADEEVDVDIDVEDEVEVDAEADDIEIERKGVKAKVEVGLSPEEEIVQDSLKAAMDAAEALGSDKLADQIGNTITFFTRQFVVGDRTD